MVWSSELIRFLIICHSAQRANVLLQYDSEREWFNIQPDYQLKNEEQKDVKVSIKMTN